MADIESLYDCLVGIHENKAHESILDKYDVVRRRMWHEFIDVVSSANLQRLNRDGAVTTIEEDSTIQMLLRSSEDPDLARSIQLVSSTSYHLSHSHDLRNRAEIRYCMTSRRTTEIVR